MVARHHAWPITCNFTNFSGAKNQPRFIQNAHLKTQDGDAHGVKFVGRCTRFEHRRKAFTEAIQFDEFVTHAFDDLAFGFTSQWRACTKDHFQGAQVIRVHIGLQQRNELSRHHEGVCDFFILHHF